MVSKIVICVLLLALVAVSYAKPHHDQSSEHRNQRQRNGQNQQDCQNMSQQDSDSNESDRTPCRLINDDTQRQGQGRNQGRKQSLHIQDTSNEFQEQLRRIKVKTSQEEDNVEKVIRQGPRHKMVNYNQRPLGQTVDNESDEETNSGRNRIYQH